MSKINFFKKVKSVFNKSACNLYSFFSLGLTKLNWGMPKFLWAYEISAYVYACVKKRGEKVGQTNWKLFQGDKEINEHWILSLLSNPNSSQTGNEFFELYQTYKDLTGETYILMLRAESAKEVDELHILRPDWIVKINYEKESGEIVSYEYRLPRGKNLTLPAQNVIASYYPNPKDQRRGLSPLKAGAMAVDTENQLSTYQNSVIRNGGKIEGILNYKAELTKDQIAEIKDEFEKQYSNAKNSGKPLVTYGDASYTNIGLSPSELSFIESKKMTRDDIKLIYQVPDSLLGLTDKIQRGNYEESVRTFLSETVKPLVDNLVAKLNNDLVPEQYTLVGVLPIPKDKDLILKEVTNGAKNYYMTVNEMRDKVGLPSIGSEGDVINQPVNLLPSPVTVEEKQVKKKSKKKEAFVHPLRNEDFRRKYHEAWLKQLDRKEEKFLRSLRKVLRAQRDRLIDNLLSQQVRSIRKTLLDETFDAKKEAELTVEAMLPIMVQYYEDAGVDVAQLFEVAEPFTLTATDKTTIIQRTELFSKEITDTTVKQLQSQFNQSLADGETREQLAKRVETLYGNISKGRALNIARTETGVADQSGRFAGYERANVPIKIWVSILDDVTRPSHQTIDGEEQLLQDQFSNGLMYPLDPSGPASEVVNCRCTI